MRKEQTFPVFKKRTIKNGTRRIENRNGEGGRKEEILKVMKGKNTEKRECVCGQIARTVSYRKSALCSESIPFLLNCMLMVKGQGRANSSDS